MNDNSYQKLAELIGKAPRLLGPGGLFGGINQEHGLMVDFIKFAKALKLGKNMSPETVNIKSFVAYLGEHKNAEEIARKLYDMRQNGEIVDDPHVKEKNTLFNLAETLFDLGVGERPENVSGDYERVLMETLSSRAGATRSGQSRRSDEIGPEAPSEEKAEAKTKGPASGLQGATPGEREIASPETPLSTTDEGLTDQAVVAEREKTQTDTFAIGAETGKGQLNLEQKDSVPGNRAAASRSGAEAPSEEEAKAKKDEIAAAPESAQAEEPLKIEGAASAPSASEASTSKQEKGESKIKAAASAPQNVGTAEVQLRPLIAPVAGHAAGGIAGQAAGEALAGTRAALRGEQRHIAQLLDGGRMLREGSRKQDRGSAEAKQDQARQTAPGRTSGQDFANHQAAQPQKSRVGRRVAGGAGIAGSLALMKGMYGGAAANAASFGILQTILDLLT